MNFSKVDEAIKAYGAGQCDTFTADISQLYAVRLTLARAADHVILPDVIPKEPLAPVVRQRDDEWMMIVKWTLYAMIKCGRAGSENIDDALKSKKPEVMRLVGTEGDYGEELGLTWVGLLASSAMSAITLKFTSAMSVQDRSCKFPAGSTSSGAPAESSMRRR
jgi:general L-amino acid transport system substrate-binding protein